MSMKEIRLELARNPDFPEGSAAHGYLFHAPLDDTGHLDQSAWPSFRDRCTVDRFWGGEPAENGHLRHTRGRRWVFHYDGMDDDEDEPIFAFDRHAFIEGEYVSITEHDGVQRTFRVVSVR